MGHWNRIELARLGTGPGGQCSLLKSNERMRRCWLRVDQMVREESHNISSIHIGLAIASVYILEKKIWIR
jgi:hypothetical protein